MERSLFQGNGVVKVFGVETSVNAKSNEKVVVSQIDLPKRDHLLPVILLIASFLAPPRLFLDCCTMPDVTKPNHR
jgi:hypothetical protein